MRRLIPAVVLAFVCGWFGRYAIDSPIDLSQDVYVYAGEGDTSCAYRPYMASLDGEKTRYSHVPEGERLYIINLAGGRIQVFATRLPPPK